jgi:hypothetical protein
VVEMAVVVLVVITVVVVLVIIADPVAVKVYGFVKLVGQVL